MTITVSTWRRADRHYTPISNQFLRAKVPASAFRVACYMLSHREGWQLTFEQIGKSIGMNRETVGNAVKKLEELGYAIRIDLPREQGRIAGTRLIVSDVGFTDDDRAEIAQLTAMSENPARSDGPEEKVQVETMSENPARSDSGGEAPENPTDSCRKIQQNPVGKSGDIRRTREDQEEDGSPSRGTSPARGGAREEEPPISPQPDAVERPLTRDANAELPAMRLVEDAMPGGLSAAERRTAVMLLAENGGRHYPVIAHLRAGRDEERRSRTFRDETLAVHRRTHERAEEPAVGEGSGARETAGVA